MNRTIISLFVLAAAFAQSGYHEIKKIVIGGEGGWDYLIADGGRVYVSHTNEVDVVDPQKSEVVGKITGLKGVHGIALATEFGRGFISNGQGNSVTIFDLKKLEKIGDDDPAGMNPDAIIYDSGSKRVFAMNGRSGDLTAIDAEKGNLAGTVPLEGKLEFAAADGEGARLCEMAKTVRHRVRRFDSKKLVAHQWAWRRLNRRPACNIDRKSRPILWAATTT